MRNFAQTDGSLFVGVRFRQEVIGPGSIPSYIQVWGSGVQGDFRLASPPLHVMKAATEEDAHPWLWRRFRENLLRQFAIVPPRIYASDSRLSPCLFSRVVKCSTRTRLWQPCYLYSLCSSRREIRPRFVHKAAVCPKTTIGVGGIRRLHLLQSSDNSETQMLVAVDRH